MTQAPASAAKPSPSASRGHEGSAAPQLTGRGMLMTWLLSVLAHILIFGFMFVVPWVSSMLPDANEAPIPLAQLVGDPDTPSFSTAATHEFDDKPLGETTEIVPVDPKHFADPTESPVTDSPDFGIIGIGEGGGDSPQFGLGGGAEAGPSFFGLGQSATGARRIVFVVDKSGSMTDSFDMVRRELLRCVGELGRTQKFHVICFSQRTEDRPAFEENPPRRLVSAIESSRRELAQFIAGVRPEGGTEPSPAMRRAFDLEPDLIYFLTDGDFDPKLLGELIHLNRDKRVRICTIAYMSPDGSERLKQIAREHRGEFKYVTERDIP